MHELTHQLSRFLSRAVGDSGQTMSEYAIALLVISLTSVTLFTGLSGGVAHAVKSVARLLP